MSKPTRTHKLGEIVIQDAPHFTMRKRMPGWHPDADGNTRKELYIEEAIRVDDDGKFEHFPVPTSGGGPFSEPTTPAEEAVFNRWILGGSIPNRRPREPKFITLLRELAILARRYNASLHRLRRLHFFLTAPAGSPLPPKNPHGDEDLPPAPGTTIKEMIKKAENDYKRVTGRIDRFIDTSQHGFKVVAADMVEVNNYIVSMRVVVKSLAHRVVGSSSSHVSISSAFSSS